MISLLLIAAVVVASLFLPEAKAQVLILGIAAAVAAWYAYETRCMARSTRAQLQFMRDEADAQTRANLVGYAEIGGGAANYRKGGVHLSNGGPGVGHNIVCHCWLTTDEQDANLAHVTNAKLSLRQGEAWDMGFEFKASGDQNFYRASRGQFEDLKFLVTWMDERNRHWACIQWTRTGSECDDISLPWPPQFTAHRIAATDLLVTVEVDTRRRYKEVKDRLSTVRTELA